MPASEREIESAIEKLKSSPGTFQTLVERYAQFTYPHHFKQVVPLGRKSNNVTVKGWPDVYSLTEDFRLCVAEVTHSPDWPKHLEEDIEKAETLGKGRFASFLFVAWDNEPSPLTDHQKINPRYEKLAHFRERLIALDIPTDGINFVFKKQLINTLREPRFAAVLKEILGLSFHSIPFRLIRESNLFGEPDRAEAFAPAEKEYLEGLVHRASLAEDLEQRLTNRGWAWVRGRGAAGKTVLGIQIALDYESKSYPAYYLNLAEADVDVAQTLDALTANADEHVLFVVDNVHLNEGFARDIFNHWQQVSLGSRLLLLGRDVTVADVRGTANPLEDLQADAQTLIVSPADLAGVFHRLARRFLAMSTTCPTVPAGELPQWQALFGGDLIAFSAAVALRIRQLTVGDWQLQPRDAANYIRETYLEKASEAERLNLLRMAVLAQLEIDLPVEAINRAGIKGLLQSGLVHRVVKGRGRKYEHYHLIHPGLGDLLLTAADYAAADLKRFTTEQLCYVSQENPYFAQSIAHRLEAANREQDAIAVLRTIVESDRRGLKMLITSGLKFLHFNCERLVRLNLLSEDEIDQKLANEPLVLSEAALLTPLGDLVTSLTYAERKMPQVSKALQNSLTQPENLVTLSQTALRTPLHFLVTFLNYAERKLPQAFIAFQSALAERENLVTLSQTALRTPLHFLVTFLNYAERKLPQAFIAFQAALAERENLVTLSQTTLRTPLGDVAFFLGYTERKLPQAFIAFQSAWAEPKNLAMVSQTALRTPLQFLVAFLDYAKRKLPQAFIAVQSALARPENLATLSQTAPRMPLSDLVTFLDYAERNLPQALIAFHSALTQPENLVTLTQTALRTPLENLAFFLDYAERELPQAFIVLQRALVEPENLATVSQTALRTPLEHLAYFLGFAECKLPATSAFLNSRLAEAESIQLIAGTASREGLGNLLKFLRVARIAPEVIAAIDRDEWDRSRLADRSEQPSFIHGLAKELQRLGRPELAEAPARALISIAEQQHWHTPGIGLPQLSQVVRLGHAAGTETVLRFLDRIATPAWLEKQYEVAPAGPLAASLFGLWGSCEQPVLDHFRVRALSWRLVVEMTKLDKLIPKLLSAALQLLGSSALIDVHAEPIESGMAEESAS